jgi:DNA-binding transcriptional ArsR family regulator
MPSPVPPARTADSVSDRYTVALEPAFNVLDSLMLLNAAPDTSGLGAWVSETAARLPAETATRNRLVLQGLYFAVLPERSWPTFPAYVDGLAAKSPDALANHIRDALVERTADPATARVEWDALLASLPLYLAFLVRHFPTASIDRAIESEVHRLLNQPDELQQTVVAHLRHMWEAYAAAEWERAEPLLEAAVNVLRRLPLAGLTPLEAVRAVTGQELLGERQKIVQGASRIVFVPSLHTGPYLDPFVHGDLMWLIFGARLPDGVGRDSEATSPLLRSDVLVRLSALTDDTRLRMLSLLAHHSELCSQEIMARLRITQSATSRHLRQLSAAGFVVERRREGAKCYSLRRERIGETFGALERLLGGGEPG